MEELKKSIELAYGNITHTYDGADRMAEEAIELAIDYVLSVLPEETVTRQDLCPYCYEDEEKGLNPYNAGKSLAVREFKTVLEAMKS